MSMAAANLLVLIAAISDKKFALLLGFGFKQNCIEIAEENGGGNARYVSRADGCRKRRAKCLKLRNSLFIGFFGGGAVLFENASYCIFPPVPDMMQLKEFGA